MVSVIHLMAYCGENSTLVHKKVGGMYAAILTPGSVNRTSGPRPNCVGHYCHATHGKLLDVINEERHDKYPHKDTCDRRVFDFPKWAANAP